MNVSYLEKIYELLLNAIQVIPAWVFYVMLFGGGMVQILFGVIPGDAVLISSGIYCGVMSLTILQSLPYLLMYWLGTICACIGVYELFLRHGNQLIEHRFFNQLFPLARRDKIIRFVEKYGVPVLLISKFIPGVNTLCIAVCGTAGNYKRRAAYPCMLVAAGVHNGLYFLLGRMLHGNMQSIFTLLRTASISGMVVLGTVVLIILCFVFFRKAR